MDLNREIAIHVMGWPIGFIGEEGSPHIDWVGDENPSCFPVYAYDAERVYTHCCPYDFYVWNPLKDLNQCLEVVEKFKDYQITIEYCRNVWRCEIYDYENNYIEEANILNIAILKAALAACQRESE
jgi:hypothetical protein